MATTPTAGARTSTPGPKRPGMVNLPGQPKKKRRWLLRTFLTLLLLFGTTYVLGRMVEPIRLRLQPLPLVGALLFSDPVWPVLWNKGTPADQPVAADAKSPPAASQPEPAPAESAAAQELKRLEAEAATRIAAAEMKEADVARRESELAAREQALKDREASIADQESKLGEELKRTENLRTQLEGQLRSEQDRAEVIRSMKSSAVLLMFGTMTDAEIIQVLKYMEASEVAKLLAGMDPYRSTRILLSLRQVAPSSAP